MLKRLIRRLYAKAWFFKLMLNLYAPYRGAGIRITHLDKQFKHVIVTMTLTRKNKNFVGTQFGGSLYSMVDPMFMLLLMQRLGSGYYVWDKAAHIDFIRPGKGTVSAHISINDDMINDVLKNTANGEKYLPEWPADIFDEDGTHVAKVKKTLYIKKKPTIRSTDQND